MPAIERKSIADNDRKWAVCGPAGFKRVAAESCPPVLASRGLLSDAVALGLLGNAREYHGHDGGRLLDGLISNGKVTRSKSGDAISTSIRNCCEVDLLAGLDTFRVSSDRVPRKPIELGSAAVGPHAQEYRRQDGTEFHPEQLIFVDQLIGRGMPQGGERRRIVPRVRQLLSHRSQRPRSPSDPAFHYRPFPAHRNNSRSPRVAGRSIRVRPRRSAGPRIG